MEDIKNKIAKKDYQSALKSEYIKSLKDDNFKKLVNTLKIKEEVALKYTSKLENTVCQLGNCSNCKSLMACKNPVEGMVYYPTVSNDRLEFNYVACKYKKKELKEKEGITSKFYAMPYEIKKAKMADIELGGKRVKIIKWLTNFFDKYQKDSHQKGLYLHGSFGSGKTYLISALLNELSKIGNTCVIVYYPELIRSIKESFSSGEDYFDRMNEIKNSSLLLLDDIGAESVTAWNRDEVLGTILQYRMDNKMPTFFTSNLTLEELESHLITKSTDEEKVKARRIMERIKQLSDSEELIGENTSV